MVLSGFFYAPSFENFARKPSAKAKVLKAMKCPKLREKAKCESKSS